MRGTFEQLRERNPGKWLLIRLDGPEVQTGELLASHEEPERVDAELESHFDAANSRDRPLYVTYSVPEDERLPSFIL